MRNWHNSFIYLLVISYYAISFSYADQIIIVNGQNQLTPSCNQNQSTSQNTDQAAGVIYNKQTNQITYTTGDKKPYQINTDCNTSVPTLDPYVFIPTPRKHPK